MPKFRNYQTNFSGGLLSEGMLGRLDLAQYENGCKQLTNWWPKVTGGMRRRPGSLHLAFADEGLRIESFIFSETQTYLFEFRVPGVGGSQDELNIYNPDTGALVDSVNITGITWNATVIEELSITQTGDVMFCAHELFPTLMIRRTGASTFVQEAFAFETTLGDPDVTTAPFIKYADIEVTLALNNFLKGTAGVTATASTAYFEDKHVGINIRYRGKQCRVTAVGTPGGISTTCTVTIKEDLDRGAVLTMDPLVHSPADYLDGEIVVGRDSGIKAEVIETSNTSVTIAMIAGLFPPGTATEEVEGLTSGNIGVITGNSNVNPVASSDWDEEAFSDDQGWPSVIEFHSQRLWLAGSSSLPAHIFGSRVAAFFNFDAGDAFPADSIQVVIAGKQINLITDIVSGRHLQVFTDAGEFYAPQSEDLPLQPETFDLLQQTRYGSNRLVEPKVFDESTIYVQAQGNAIREYIWIDNQRGYSSDAISLIAEEHIADVKEVEVLYGGYDRPEQIAFFVNGDGTITWYHAARAEQIRTWGKWTTQGNYKSLCVIQDKLFALVERPTDAGVANALERFELDLTLDASWQDTDTAKSAWTFTTARYTGVTVQATSGVTAGDADYYLGAYVPVANVVDVDPILVDNITVGLGFTQTLETMPIEVKDQNGVTGGMPKRLVSADVYMASTLAITLEGNRVRTFLGELDLADRPLAITGPRKFYLLGYSERPTITITNDIPLPCEALALGAEVEY